MQARENTLAASSPSLSLLLHLYPSQSASLSLMLCLSSDAIRDLADRCNLFRAQVRVSKCVCMQLNKAHLKKKKKKLYKIKDCDFKLSSKLNLHTFP